MHKITIMNLQRLLPLLVCAMLVQLPILSQQIVSIVERTPAKDKVVADGYMKIVDINSELKLNVSREAIAMVINDRFPELLGNPAMDAEIIKLEKALEDQAIILNWLQNNFNKLKDRNAFYAALGKFTQFATTDQDLGDEVERLKIEFNALKKADPLKVPKSSTEFIFLNLKSKLGDLKNVLASVEDEGKIKISLVGYKKDGSGGGRVHIRNFDEIADYEFVTVPRFVTSMSPKQAEKLKGISKKIDTSQVKLRDLFDDLKAQFNDLFPNLSCAKNMKSRVEDLLKNNSELGSALTTDAQKSAKDFIKQLDGLTALSEALKTDVNDWTIGTAFTITDSILKIINDLNSTDVNIKSWITSLDTAVKPEDWRGKFTTDFSDCLSGITAGLEDASKARAMLFNQNKNYIANKDIGEEVFRFSIGDLPGAGFLDLRETGQRSAGDEIQIEVVMFKGNKDESGDTKDAGFGKPLILEKTNLKMEKVGVHSEIAVGVIFAAPFSDDIDVVDPARTYFFTPSVSFLLKFGSRKSNFYNDFVDMGIGINFASPDFNTDGTPEFGTGIIVTALKDILSTGVNYNVTNNTVYWFFGVNLPFNIPGFPVSSIQKTNK